MWVNIKLVTIIWIVEYYLTFENVETFSRYLEEEHVIEHRPVWKNYLFSFFLSDL